jgi:putative transposase
LKGRHKVPKDVKLSILNIVEGSNLKKSFLVKTLGITPIKYFRWAHKYYLDNTLDDKRGGYRIKKQRLEDVYRKQIIDIRKNKFLGKAVIGPERIADALEDQGVYISHETIRKVLHQEGLIIPRPRVEIHEYKRFEAESINSMWQMDFLYLNITGLGYHFLWSVLDDYSRKIIYWQLTPQATAQDAIDTVKGAISAANVVPKDILTDRGTQFFSGPGRKKGGFETYLKSMSINHILARVRHPQTMGKIERYHRSLRQECLNHFEFDDPIEARREIRAYNHAYNNIRKHKGIGRVTPQSRYSGEDKAIRFNRLKIRNQIKLEQNLRFDDPKLDTLVAIQETVSFVKLALQKEVIIS